MSLEWLDESRRKTLAFVDGLDDDALRAWPDPAFSPVCWHLGHIAFTEASWILEHCGGDDALSKPYHQRWAQDGCAKHQRADGFQRDELFDYMQRVRRATHERWPTLDHPMKADDYLAWFVAAHEDQHRETIRIVHTLSATPHERIAAEQARPTRIEIEGGDFFVGTDSPRAYDNERPRLAAHLHPFRIDAHPTTCAAFQRFIDEDGYRREALWSPEGWSWLRASKIEAPRVPMRSPRHPVMGISFYEAEAYARFCGGRLPTEQEHEYLAQRFGDGAHLDADAPRDVTDADTPTDVIGNVWEWTADWFEPREGFTAHPYRGYSEPYFGGTHRVMRGGSFATSKRIGTSSFRNWYVPESRQLFVGVRVAYD